MGFGGSSEAFIQGSLIFGVVVLFMMPVMMSVFLSPQENNENLVSEDIIEELNNSYMNFTVNGSKKEQPWALTGIYTPYIGGAYNYTPDGWLYGEMILKYSPSQYAGTTGSYTVVRGMSYTEDNDEIEPDTNFTGVVYTYATNNQMDNHKPGDVYTYVTMDVSKQSEIFFTEQLKHSSNQQFYYEYTGYRYAFQALENGYTIYTDSEGNKSTTKLNATTSSLSLIWYNVVGQTGISGQLVLSGSDFGVSQITASDIINAFNSATNTARFEMNFNGIPMFIYIRIDPSMTQQGMSVEECYDRGYWSLMVSSLSTDPQDYYSADFSFSPDKILDTALALMTFNLDDYDMSDNMRVIASLVFNMVLLTMILAIGLKNPKILLIAGIATLIVMSQDYITMFVNSITNFVNAVIEYFNIDWPPDVDISLNPSDWEWWPW